MSKSPSPARTKYEILADTLREHLRSHPAGRKFPSIRALRTRFKVSQHTVLSALELLEKDGLIHRRHGSGIYFSKRDRPVTLCLCRTRDISPGWDCRERALRAACETRGWNMVVDRFDSLRVNLLADEVDADAFVLSPELVTFQSPLLGRLVSQKIPTLILGRDTSSAQLDFVTGNDLPIIREFLLGLVERGHKRIAFLNSEPPFHEVVKRIEYFTDVCQLLGVESHPVLDVGAQYGLDGIEKSENFLREYLTNRRVLPFTALMADSLSGTVPAPLAFHEAGFEIPRDLSLCSLGVDSRAQYCIPPIACAAPHYTELAEAALAIVEKRLAGDKSPLLFERITHGAIWRASVGSAPCSDKKRRRPAR